MNLKSTWTLCATLLILPSLKCYANTAKRQIEKKRLEFLAKRKHNFEFNISLGHNFSYVTYNTRLKTKLFTATGEFFLNDEEKNDFYSLPNLSKKFSKLSENSFIDDDVRVDDPFHPKPWEALLDLGNGLDLIFLGSVIPLQFDLNYIYDHFIKVGISEQLSLGVYYLFYSKNLSQRLKDCEADKKISDDILVQRVKRHNTLDKLSIDSKTYLNLGIKIFDYRLYSLWLNLQNGFALKCGNKFFTQSLMKGYAGNLFLSLEKYLSKRIKFFYNAGMGLNVYWTELLGKDRIMLLDYSIFNFSVGFSFGSNDGRYEDYIYQKEEYDYYVDKYQRTFEYDKEFIPFSEE